VQQESRTEQPGSIEPIAAHEAMPVRSTAHRVLLRLRWLWGHTVAMAMRTDEDHVFMMAAGIAFNFITALVPTILLILFILGYVLDSAAIMRELNYYASTFIVSQGNRQDILETISEQITSLVQNRGIAGAIGIVGLLWTASALATSIRVAVNRVLRCREVRHYLIYKLYDMAAIMLIGLLVFVSILIGPLMQLVLRASDKIGTVLHLAGFDWLVSTLVNIAITLVLFYTIFRYMPYQRQERHIIWIGTLTSTLLWELAREVFSFYLAEFTTFSRVYGAYAFFAATAFWLYYSALVFMIGAEVAYHIKQSRWNARRTFNRISTDEP
jgi:membrane protein